MKCHSLGTSQGTQHKHALLGLMQGELRTIVPGCSQPALSLNAALVAELQEIDYTLEGQSADRFRTNFGKEDWLKVPKIFWDRTTTEVLTMEYCPGVKINRISELDKMGVDRKRLAKLAVESYLQQILTYGFFHAGRGMRHSMPDLHVCLCLFFQEEQHYSCQIFQISGK